ncbi:hypothetical protein FNV58_00700 (plasmid) [Streptomyces sp. RLB1-9]|uniref:hypothetical protein n=1 Tax=Streptomyces sp. RLB1-9 TaxID=2594454 RepID=UPI0011659CBF|nr:hypothetical protein [Streptomyces sp. RLB1-9]QDN94879.1 hypothetical protein FNV58_00700 [Streptomyces sp. RLB1-9]
MPELIFVVPETYRSPHGEPTCCPDSYICLSGGAPEMECPRHGGFDVCCDQPEAHVLQNREDWHRLMDRWEQGLLDQHISRYKILQAFELESTPLADLLSDRI